MLVETRAILSAFQDCHDYCGTSPGSNCSCSLVNSVVYQKMMTIAGTVGGVDGVGGNEVPGVCRTTE